MVDLTFDVAIEKISHAVIRGGQLIVSSNRSRICSVSRQRNGSSSPNSPHVQFGQYGCEIPLATQIWFTKSRGVIDQENRNDEAEGRGLGSGARHGHWLDGADGRGGADCDGESIFGRGAGYDSAHRHERCTKAHANGRAHAAAFSATRARRRPHRSARARRQRFQRSALSGRSSARRKVGFSSSSHTANGSAGLGVPSRCRSKPSASWVGSWRRSTCRLANMQPRRPGRERTQLPCLTI